MDDLYLQPLTRREIEVLRWICIGKTNLEISIILNISSYTVKNHIKSIFNKLGVSNRTHAAQKAMSSGILEQMSSPNCLAAVPT